MCKNKKKVYISVAAVLLCSIMISLFYVFDSSAQMVDVYTTPNDLQLEWKNIWGSLSRFEPPSEESCMISQSDGEYIMKTNGYALWSPNDSISYAYMKAPFNAGEESVMTIKLTIDSFDGHEVGINVRESLAPGSKNHSFGYFPKNSLRWAIRSETDEEYAYSQSAVSGITVPNEPLHLKLVLNKESGIIYYYYKSGGDVQDDSSGWVTFASKPAKFIKKLTSLYVGIAVGSGNSNEMCRATCSNFSVKLQAPEGYVLEEEGSVGGTDDNDKPTIQLPDDFPAPQDALLYETFTDGNMYPNEYDVKVANPLWTVGRGEAIVTVSEEEKNAYLEVSPVDDALMMYAGDQTWTDYTAQMDFAFTDKVLPDEENRVDFLFRNRTYVVGGSGDYSATIVNKLSSQLKFAGQYLQLRYRSNTEKYVPAGSTVLAEVCLSETAMMESGVTHTLKVCAIDNVFKIYLDDMKTPLIEYTDSNEKMPHLNGGVGISANYASVQIDNILVRKMMDPLGGDYDNRIKGNYDEPVPEWLDKYYGY